MSLPWQTHLLLTTSLAALVTSVGGGGDGTQWDFSGENNSAHIITCGLC